MSPGVLRQPLPLHFCPRQYLSSKMGPSSQRGSVLLEPASNLAGECYPLSAILCDLISISYYSFLSHAETKDNNLVAKYHPNFWMDSKWRCCQQTEKLAAGCHVYDPLGFGLYSLFHFVFRELIMRWTHDLDVTHTTADFEHLDVSHVSTASKKPLPQLPDPKVNNLWDTFMMIDM